MGLAKTLNYYWNERADPRTMDLPLMASPYTVPLSLVVYVYFIFVWGPKYMKDRKPYNLESFRKRYDIFQIVANSYIIYEFIQAGWFTTISPFCELADYSYNPGPLRVARTMWLVTLLKYIDLVETVVFILRKKYNQVTFLHVYHHITTLLITWCFARYVPVAMASFPAMVNCGIHVLMYSYYYLSTLGPNIRNLVKRFKPILTIMQMAQFIVLILHCSQSFLPSCTVPKTPGTILTINLIINFILFYNFYQQQYVKKATHKK